jgi:hypothetical protein
MATEKKHGQVTRENGETHGHVLTTRTTAYQMYMHSFWQCRRTLFRVMSTDRLRSLMIFIGHGMPHGIVTTRFVHAQSLGDQIVSLLHHSMLDIDSRTFEPFAKRGTSRSLRRAYSGPTYCASTTHHTIARKIGPPHTKQV